MVRVYLTTDETVMSKTYFKINEFVTSFSPLKATMFLTYINDCD